MSGGVNYDSPKKPDNTNQVEPSGLLNIGAASNPEPVKDITTAEFMPEVVDASNERPVLIDFWAPWCGPCKQLAPILEKAVADARGKVKLVKMNIDEHPEISGQMGIKSIPAVVAFVNGKPADGFMGAKSEHEIVQFIEKLVGPTGPSELDMALAEANECLETEQYEKAAHLFSAIINQVPDNRDAIAGYGMVALKLDQLEQAKQVLEHAGDVKGHQGLESLKAAIALEEQAAEVGDYSDLTDKVEKEPENKDLRFDLAIAMAAAGKHEEAADHLLEIIAKDRKWRDDGARAQLVQFFEAWGPKDPATSYGRRRLSSLLFS
jgi:putative thioredoxin